MMEAFNESEAQVKLYWISYLINFFVFLNEIHCLKPLFWNTDQTWFSDQVN